MAATLTAWRPVLRHSTWDALFVAVSLAHAVVLVTVPSIPVLAIGQWWNANTISHNFVHRQFFRARALNRLYSIYLSLLLGVPQSVWRQRHLRHHAELSAPPDRRRAIRLTPAALVESGAVLILWALLAWRVPRLFARVYVPGYLIGLALCFLQGHFEHARGTTSHYGRLYNSLFFNDGYHVEHHLRPGAHWTELPGAIRPGTRRSRWPPVLRWLDVAGLESLERLVLRSPALQRFVLSKHERAFRALMPKLPPIRRITVVGGGLFPRTALILRKLLPEAAISIVDVSAKNLEIARTFLDGTVELVHDAYDLTRPSHADLVVIPLAFLGDRSLIRRIPSGPAILAHDWIWSRHAQGATVSWLLVKRLNLVRANPDP